MVECAQRKGLEKKDLILVDDLSPNEQFDSEYPLFEIIYLSESIKRMNQDAYKAYMNLETLYSQCEPTPFNDFRMDSLRRHMQKYAEMHRE